VINVNKFTTAPTKLSAVNDIILSIRASIGDKVWSDSVYCLGRGVAAIRPSPSFDKRFLWHTLTHLEKNLAAKGKGATFQQVNKEDISSLKIPHPPLPEQKRIAAILDKADELKSKREATIAKLDQLAQSIFVEMFGNVIVNDKGWQILRLGDVGTLDRGISKHRPRNAPELLGGDYPLVQTGEVANCDGYIRSHNSSYSEIGLRQSKMWPAGTLCITIAANIAKTGILTFDACFPDSVVGFRSDNTATVEYVRVWLTFLQKMLEESAPESAQKNINLAILRELSIPFPPIALQEEFIKRLKAMQSLKVKFSTALAKQNNLFTSLQHQAFSGQL
jgi:type I restriction enzyme, S subunit